MRSASECVRRSHCAARHNPTLNALVGRSGRLSAHHHTRDDKTVLFASCLVYQCELIDCGERVQTSYFLSATVLSCRESNSHRRSGRDLDKTVLSCLAWRRRELALNRGFNTHFFCRYVTGEVGKNRGLSNDAVEQWCADDVNVAVP